MRNPYKDLQPLWSSSLTKPYVLRFRCSSGHVLSKTKSVTPIIFTFLTSLTHHLSTGKIFRKKSKSKFVANVLKSFLSDARLLESPRSTPELEVKVVTRSCFWFAVNKILTSLITYSNIEILTEHWEIIAIIINFFSSMTYYRFLLISCKS